MSASRDVIVDRFIYMAPTNKMSDPHILLFDSYASGHHGDYIQMLLDHWVANAPDGRLDLVLPSNFSSVFPDVADFARRHCDRGISLHSIRGERTLKHGSPFSFVRRDLAQGEMIRNAIQDLRPDHCLLMHIDHAQLSLWMDLRFDWPVSISGIYFRPSFHYAEIGSPPHNLRERMGRIRKRVMLSWAFTNPHLKILFSLDPFAVSHINRLSREARAVALPDGLDFSSRDHDPMQAEVHPRDRYRALLFGVLSRRKGVFAVLEALGRLPREMQRRLEVTFAGRLSNGDREDILRAVESARASSDVEIVLEDRYIPDSKVESYLEAADLILVTYQRHVGSSNVLVRAAAAQRPVLGSDFGLVGEQIRRNHLGLAVDTTSPKHLAAGLETFIRNPDSLPFDPGAARRFAESNSAEAFARTIFSHLVKR